MLTLGEELLLVALDADKGAIRGSRTIQVGLNAAGIADLCAMGWMTLRKPNGAAGVTPVSEGGDPRIRDYPLLVEALEWARESRVSDRHPERCLKTWTSPSLHACLLSLRKQGVLDWDKPSRAALYGRFRLLDAEAAASARARIERVAAGDKPTERDLDFAGIVHRLELDKIAYKGFRNRSLRAALATAVEKQRFAVLVARVVPEVPQQTFTFQATIDQNLAQYM